MKKSSLVCLSAVVVLFTASLVAQESATNPVSQKIGELAGKISGAQSGTETTATTPLSIAIVEFDNVGKTAASKKVGRIVSELLGEHLLKSGGFTLVERMHLQNVLKEMALSQTGLIDSKSAVEVGKIAGARALLCGSVSEAGKFFIVNARLIDAEQGTVLLSESIELERDGMIALSDKRIVIKKYPQDAAFRSLLLPGWGQFYNDAPVRGYLYPVLVIGTAGSAVAMHYYSKSLYTNYEELENTSESVKMFDKAQSTVNIRDGLFWTAVGIWTFNIIDAFIGAAIDLKSSSSDVSVRFDAVPARERNSFNLCIDYTF
jgi:TolB-like protein